MVRSDTKAHYGKAVIVQNLIPTFKIMYGNISAVQLHFEYKLTKFIRLWFVTLEYSWGGITSILNTFNTNWKGYGVETNA